MLRQHVAQLIAVTEDFSRIQSKLTDLYKQDKKGAYKQQVFPLENAVLQRTRSLTEKIKSSRKSDNLSESSSFRSRSSRRSHWSGAPSYPASWEWKQRQKSGGEYLQENEMKQREAEEEKHRQQARTQHDRHLAILSANRKVTVANAK